jgi:hypothetical protein
MDLSLAIPSLSTDQILVLEVQFQEKKHAKGLSVLPNEQKIKMNVLVTSCRQISACDDELNRTDQVGHRNV